MINELVDLLADTASPERVLAFRCSPEVQDRLDDLLEKSRNNRLSDSDRLELAKFETIEHLLRLLKARVLADQNRNRDTTN